jgi:hypothetical protein
MKMNIKNCKTSNKFKASGINLFCILLLIMKKFTLLILLIPLLTAFTAFAQNKTTISFTTTDIDFGKIKAIDGEVTRQIEFSNTGNKTLEINGIYSPCNCISTKHHNLIFPGYKDTIEVTVNPGGMSGPFNKSIEVVSNDTGNNRVFIQIKGEIIKSEIDDYPNIMGHLRSAAVTWDDYFSIPLNNIGNKDIKSDTLKIYNDWNRLMTLSISNLPEYITCKLIPEKQLKPHQKGIIIISYDAQKCKENGYVCDRITLSTNDSILPEKKLSISVNIVDDFSKLTPEELANAPKIKFDYPNFDFGAVMEGTEPEHDFIFTNIGKSVLFIRKVKGSNCMCNCSKSELNPGDSGVIHCRIFTEGKSGPTCKSPCIVCNDPLNSTILLSIRAYIKKNVPAIVTNGQHNATINIIDTNINFGKMRSVDIDKREYLRFSNIGNDILEITGIYSSCNSISIQLDNNLIKPGDTVTIPLYLYPKGLSGIINEHVQITSNDPVHTKILFNISGEVIKTKAGDYPYWIGHLRFKPKDYFSLENVAHTEIRSDTLEVYNDWDQNMTIRISNLPEYITCKLLPDQQLKPDQKGLIILTYNAIKKNSFGYRVDHIYLLTNDTACLKKSIEVSATVVFDPSKMTPEEIKNSPKIVFQYPNFDFGTVVQGEEIQHDFSFKNTGKKDLIIIKVECSSDGCKAYCDTNRIKPGDSSFVHITCSTKYRHGHIARHININCNDPLHEQVELILQGTILYKEEYNGQPQNKK